LRADNVSRKKKENILFLRKMKTVAGTVCVEMKQGCWFF
jgi:hypothetical protein